MRPIVDCTVVGLALAFGLGTLWIESVEESAQGSARRQVNNENQPPGTKPVVFRVPTSWEYSAPLIAPEKRDSNPSRAQKDPTVVFYCGKWHVFMTVKLPGSSAIEYCSFESWEHANESERTILKISKSDYYCAPQVFYFAPHQKWYLIYQMGAPGTSKMWVAYSTTTDIADPDSWTQARPILDGGKKDPRKVGGLDYWIICDNERAYLFLTSLNGKMWRLWTRIEDFPRGFDHCELALEAEIFEASHTYKLKGMNKYLTVIEEDGRRYYKAYLADRLDGSWTPIADTAERPFAGWKNVRPAPGVEPWTDNVSHGELIRDGYDQTLTVDPEDLRFIFQGMWDKDKSGRGYGKFQWRIGMLRPVSTSQTQMAGPTKTERPRVIVLTDIGGDPDDQQSMVRFLVYANEFDVQGLIATTSGWKRDAVHPDSIKERLEAYGQVRGNLVKHASGYPSKEYLLSVTKSGRAASGMAAVGHGKNSEGSNHIIEVVDRPDPRPVWICIWGGANDLAQALWDVNETRSESDIKTFVSRLRVYDLAGQDDAGAWICQKFPNIFWIRSQSQWRGISHRVDGNSWHNTRGGNESLMEPDWIARNIQSHGPLGELYANTKYLTEGDTPTFLHLLPTGLADPEHIYFGNWGGRFSLIKKKNCRGVPVVKTERNYDDYWMYTGTTDTWTYRNTTYRDNPYAPVFRWREAFQNDFAARMDWSITDSYDSANHNPIAAFKGDTGREIVEMVASSGEEVELSAAGSSDPDGNELSYRWWQYREPGSFSGAVNIIDSNARDAGFVAPNVSAPKTIHVILTVMDDGHPNLYNYRRIIVTVKPK